MFKSTENAKIKQMSLQVFESCAQRVTGL